MTGVSFYLAASLMHLRDQVNARYPRRDKASDGWLGDTSHQARVSDHNPDPSSQPPGVVRAIDVDINPDGNLSADLRTDLLRACIGDVRVWYVISNRVIYSRTHDWAPRAYTGSNPHEEHVHISLRGADGITVDHAHDIAFDGTDWWAQGILDPVYEARIRRASRHPQQSVHPNSVRRVQAALTARGLPVRIDGVYGQATRTAARVFQERQGFTGSDADGILGATSLRLLGRNRYRTIPAEA